MLGNFNLSDAVITSMGRADGIDPRAVELFEKSYRNPRPNSVQRFFSGSPEPLFDIQEWQGCLRVTQRRYGGVMTIQIKDIQGSMDRTHDFDRDFRPIQSHSEFRWQKVATAMIRGKTLPPIEVVKLGDVYFVKDGHHRVSVARALGYKYIDAVVEIWESETNAA